jgi:hypothetical protein
MAAKKKTLTLTQVTSKAGKASAKARLARLDKKQRAAIGRQLALAKSVAWKEDQLQQAIQLRQAGHSLAYIAEVVGKSISGVSRKLKERQIVKPKIIKATSRF